MARFANTIDNQPIYAARAEADKNGDRIDTTYAKLTDIPNVPVQDVEVNGSSVVNAQGVAEITVPTATSDLTNDSDFITASDVAANQEQADWSESDSSDPSYIQNKPDLSIYAETADLATVATTGDYGDLLNTPTIPAAQVQTDWTEADSTSKAYIQHKPDLSVYAQSSSLATVATTGDYDDLVNKPSIPAAQVNSDWNASSGVAQILNKPNLATVATSGNYNDLSNLPTIPQAVTVDQHYDALSSNPQSGTAVAEALSGTGQVPTVTSSDDSKVLMASYSGGQGSYSWQPTAAATQVNSDWEATSGVAEILHKPDLSVYAETADLATVATTGSYNDLTDKPSIPAAQVNADWNASSGVAQILNKPTIPAAQIQSNWNEADSTSKAYIQNKPDLSVYAQSSSLATVATTGDYDDLVDAPTIVGLAAGANVTITEANNTVTIAATDTTYTAGTGISISGGAISNSDPIPSHTSTQSGQVLGVDSNGDLGWVTPTNPTVDQSYNALSTNAQSGTAVAGAIATVRQLPTINSWDGGKYLRSYYDSSTGTSGANWTNLVASYIIDAGDITDNDMEYLRLHQSEMPIVLRIALTPTGYQYADRFRFAPLVDAETYMGPEDTIAYFACIENDTLYSYKVQKVDNAYVTTPTVTQVPSGGSTQVQADWTESDPTDVSYIQHKPTQKPLVAGQNVILTEGANNITIDCTASGGGTTYSAGTGIDITSNTISVENPLPASTVADSSKVLTVDAQGTPAWASAQAPITAGNGIDITNNVVSVDTSVVATQSDLADKEDAFDVGTGLEMDTSGATPTLQVEAPVDIVAGPGIVIDNPDGNTLRVSMAADYEVELWSGVYSGSVNSSNFITLSENPQNFETIEITNGGIYKTKYRFDGSSVNWSFMQAWAGPDSTTVYANRYSVDAGNKKATCVACNSFLISANSISDWSSRSMDVGEVQLTRVVGIHRITNN